MVRKIKTIVKGETVKGRKIQEEISTYKVRAVGVETETTHVP